MHGTSKPRTESVADLLREAGTDRRALGSRLMETERCRKCHKPISQAVARIFVGLCGLCYRPVAAAEDDNLTMDGQRKKWCRP